ncbi:MAG: transcriptional repressor [Clostridiales bacterium]|nr:transcriptional repressor [Clostridiales bacterium]
MNIVSNFVKNSDSISTSTSTSNINNAKVLRNTPQRQVVLKVVRESMDHPTAETIFERARELDPNISVATVYRNLGILFQKGEINQIALPFGACHYDFNLAQHYHFYCNACNSVEDIIAKDVENKSFQGLKDKLDMPKYVINGCELIFTGLCPNCSN